MSRLSTPRALCLAILTLLAVFAIPAMTASAQTPVDQPDTYDEKVAALRCADRSCFEFAEPIIGFTINIVDRTTGDLIDSCVTDAATDYDGCLVTIPRDAQWTVSWDDAQVPEGYEYRGSIMAVSGGAYGSLTIVGFIPITPEETVVPPVVALPSTGTVAPESSSASHLGLIALAIITTALTGTALHLRRR